MTYQPSQDEDLTLKANAGKWCKYCEKVNHNTDECWSTHAIPAPTPDPLAAPKTIKMTRGLNAHMGRLIQEDQVRTRMFTPGGLSVLFPALGKVKEKK